MKKYIFFILVLAALFVFCSAAFAQYGYAVPTLETVRRGASTINVFTYRDGNGKTIREIEYYVNDDGSYGNRDLYYGNNGLINFKVQTDYKNGVCTVAEQSISYSADDLASVNSRETTFNPDGKVNILTSTLQELENGSKVVTGMETDGQGRKICDFKEEYYKDANNNQASKRTVYHPDKTVEVIHTTEKEDGSEIRNEWIFDENDKELYSLYISLDPNGKEELSDATKFNHGKDGSITEEHLIVDGDTNTQLSYIEKWEENDTSSTAKGELQDKEGNKLADYSFEKTIGEDKSEVTVATFIYPNGKVDIITKKVDADGNLSIQQQLDFKASGEKTEETPDDDFEYENFYKLPKNESTEDNSGPDDELIRYFEAINDVWDEGSDEVEEIIAEEINDDEHEDFNGVPDAVQLDSGEEIDGTGNDSSEETGGGDGGSYDWSGDDGGSYDWSGDDGGSYDWSGDDGGSYDWSGDDGGSYDWSGDDGGFYDWGGDDGGFGDWD